MISKYTNYLECLKHAIIQLMSEFSKETDFFHFIAQAVIKLVTERSRDVTIAKHKNEADFSTQVDVDVENLIISEIQKRFPEDQILAEETHKDIKIPKGRIWIIDPICGTNNLARDINNFCTNIALAKNNKLIASSVIDHSQNDYFWSVGGQKVYINNDLCENNQKRYDVMIEVDFGAVSSLDATQKERYSRFLKKIIAETNFYLISLNTSLGFAYTAIGKIDGFVNTFNHPWDIYASSFLIQESGGVITDIHGDPWNLDSVGAIAAKNKEIHSKLLDIYLTS